MFLRRLRNWLLGLLATVLILLASLSALVETQTGSRWVLQWVARLVPLELGDVQGNLRTGLDIRYLGYRQGELYIRIEQASFRWRPVDLLYGALAVQSLRAQRVLIQLPPAQPDPEPKPPFSHWPYLGIGLRIQLGGLDVRQIQFRQGDTALEWESLSGSLSLGTFHLRYRDLALEHRGYGVRLSGMTDLTFPYDTQAELEWRVGARDADPASGAAFPYLGRGQLRGDLNRLQLDATSRQPVVLNASARLALVDGQRQLVLEPQIQLQADWAQQTLPAPWWIPERQPPVTSARLEAEGNWLGYSANLKGNMQLPELPGVDLDLKLQGDTRQVRIEHLHLREQLLLNQAGSSSTALAKQASSPTSEGTQGSATPSAQVSASAGAADPNTVPVNAQYLSLSGELAWLPRLEWKLDTDARYLNIATLVEDWPSNLKLAFASHGYLDYGSKDWQLTIDQLQANGSLRDLNLEAGGQVDANPRRWRSNGLKLVLGANLVELKGGLSDQVYLQWDLRAPLLNQLDTRLSGSVQSQGQLQGSLGLPQLSMALDASQVRWGDYQVEQLKLSMQPTVAAGSTAAGLLEEASVPSSQARPLASLLAESRNQALDEAALRRARYNLSLAGSKIYIGDEYLSSLSLAGEGSAEQHNLKASVKSATYGSLDIGLNGRYDGQNWVGRLEETSMKIKQVPRWWLVSSKPIHLGGERVSVGAQCFTTRTNLTSAVERDPTAAQYLGESYNPNQSPVDSSDWISAMALQASPVEKLPPPRLCIHGEWKPDAGLALKALLDAVPLRQFYALFKPEVYFAGVMDGSLQVSGPSLALDQLKASMGVSTRNAELRYQFPGGETEIYPWREVYFRASLDKGQLAGDMRMQWDGYGSLDAETRINLLTSQINSARVKAAFHNLAPLETLMTPINNATGDFRVDITAAGPLASPQVSGDVSLRDGTANIPRLGLDLQQIQLHLTADRSERMSLVGQMHSEQGAVSLEGQLSQLGSADWQARASLRGSDFRVINLPQLRANLTPDVQLEANAEAVRVSGTAAIPWARANIKTLPPSTTKVSSDVVVVDDRLPQTHADAMAFYTNIRLTLGDDVRFKGFGLDSQLGGDMRLFKDAHRQLMTDGFVAVRKGTYKAYGQNLTIDRGRLIFQGPYDNPGLDIRASRVIEDDEDIEVGLEIGGTLQRPSAKVYSSPSRSESEAMMMLLTGKPLRDSSGADASLLLGALSGLGDDSAGITQGIANFFRVDELAINSDKGIDQSELLIGKQVTPRLMVRYMVGLFDQLTSLGVEYRLSERLRLEAESGETQSVDIIYKIER
ncbi:translocation/assembly module TamB domain-containing protein [Cellvibrio japonicus]|nr:translocation/assembly module TamB domain-containing protein [Cellvibrio japonicus]QEI13611.1 translocation/assembly module TamB [Cellvibrio japonicus]QEI17185.1 translocation/assembly module TamB [Cellvibrio japonicus]QEI20762.1 translocation/assembly module TamB [Cellvibrio japonicus]